MMFCGWFAEIAAVVAYVSGGVHDVGEAVDEVAWFWGPSLEEAGDDDFEEVGTVRAGGDKPGDSGESGGTSGFGGRLRRYIVADPDVRRRLVHAVLLESEQAAALKPLESRARDAAIEEWAAANPATQVTRVTRVTRASSVPEEDGCSGQEAQTVPGHSLHAQRAYFEATRPYDLRSFEPGLIARRALVWRLKQSREWCLWFTGWVCSVCVFPTCVLANRAVVLIGTVSSHEDFDRNECFFSCLAEVCCLEMDELGWRRGGFPPGGASSSLQAQTAEVDATDVENATSAEVMLSLQFLVENLGAFVSRPQPPAHERLPAGSEPSDERILLWMKLARAVKAVLLHRAEFIEITLISCTGALGGYSELVGESGKYTFFHEQAGNPNSRPHTKLSFSPFESSFIVARSYQEKLRTSAEGDYEVHKWHCQLRRAYSFLYLVWGVLSTNVYLVERAPKLFADKYRLSGDEELYSNGVSVTRESIQKQDFPKKGVYAGKPRTVGSVVCGGDLDRARRYVKGNPEGSFTPESQSFEVSLLCDWELNVLDLRYRVGSASKEHGACRPQDSSGRYIGHLGNSKDAIAGMLALFERFCERISPEKKAEQQNKGQDEKKPDQGGDSRSPFRQSSVSRWNRLRACARGYVDVLGWCRGSTASQWFCMCVAAVVGARALDEGEDPAHFASRLWKTIIVSPGEDCALSLFPRAVVSCLWLELSECVCGVWPLAVACCSFSVLGVQQLSWNRGEEVAHEYASFLARFEAENATRVVVDAASAPAHDDDDVRNVRNVRNTRLTDLWDADAEFDRRVGEGGGVDTLESTRSHDGRLTMDRETILSLLADGSIVPEADWYELDREVIRGGKDHTAGDLGCPCCGARSCTMGSLLVAFVGVVLCLAVHISLLRNAELEMRLRKWARGAWGGGAGCHHNPGSQDGV